MMGIVLIGLYTTVMSVVAVIITNRFNKKKIALDKKYFLETSVLFVLSIIAIYLYEFLTGNL